MNEAQCYDTFRELRWPEGRQCLFCNSKRVIRRAFDEKEPAKQHCNSRYGVGDFNCHGT